MVNPKQGIIVLEVKGGRVEIDGGIWYSVDRNDERHGIKNPFTQVADSKYSLLRHVDISREIVRFRRLTHVLSGFSNLHWADQASTGAIAQGYESLNRPNQKFRSRQQNRRAARRPIQFCNLALHRWNDGWELLCSAISGDRSGNRRYAHGDTAPMFPIVRLILCWSKNEGGD